MAVASLDDSELSGFRVTDVYVADVPGIVSNLELPKPVALGNDNAEPRGIIV